MSATRAVQPTPTHPAVRRVRLADIHYDTLSLEDARTIIRDACQSRGSVRVVTVNMGFATIARRDPRFARAIATSGLSVVDGRVLQWATWVRGRPAPEQITGHDLFRECLRLAREHGYGIFLLGGAPGVACHVAAMLERAHPGLRVAGTHHGHFSATGATEDSSRLIAQIKAFRPHVLIVALGAPKQDLWLAENLEPLAVPVGIGVGCVLDVVAGRIRRAPGWMQRAGLESLFQLVVAPGRYGRRYLLGDVPTLVRVFGDALCGRVRSWRTRPREEPDVVAGDGRRS